MLKLFWYSDFMVFLTSRWCDENMLFYDAVQVYRSLDAEKRKRKAEEIAEFYLKVRICGLAKFLISARPFLPGPTFLHLSFRLLTLPHGSLLVDLCAASQGFAKLRRCLFSWFLGQCCERDKC